MPARPFVRLLAVIPRVLLAFVGGVAIQLPAKAKSQEDTSATPGRIERLYDFNLPEQPATNALLAFSKQTKIEILFSFNALRSAHSKGVTGRFLPEEALKRILEGTGFSAQP